MSARTKISMDGGTFVKTADGSIMIKRKTGCWGWFYVVVLGAPILGLAAWLAFDIFRLPKGTSTLIDNWTTYVMFVFVGGLLGWALRTHLRSMRLPPVQVNVASKMLEIGRGSSLDKIPFSSIIKVIVSRSGSGSFGGDPMGVFSIGVELDNVEIVSLGTVSGKVEEARDRATSIAKQIADATGAENKQSKYF